MSKPPQLFDFLKSIGERGGDEHMLDDPVALKAYNMFMVTRGLAQNQGTLSVANELNRCGFTDKQLHYAFAYHATPKAKRYGGWAKKAPMSEDVEFVRGFYECNEERALEMIKLMTKEQLEQLKARDQKGGLVQTKTNRKK
ncbi:gp62 clamp loader subunit [Delftia phage PhiW-14]|uniref:Sliding-clamp-loader small subunit n=1 Tax=Delftia phage PhiW-14 TaxID=665032 RepID=C9DGI3_BPW14|nr:clamp loader of DNA polymerase [Delftia phage PhiW-14]ACV50234.1 gp62 clamp loader subunit [Delftia phage PhiW-14]